MRKGRKTLLKTKDVIYCPPIGFKDIGTEHFGLLRKVNKWQYYKEDLGSYILPKELHLTHSSPPPWKKGSKRNIVLYPYPYHPFILGLDVILCEEGTYVRLLYYYDSPNYQRECDIPIQPIVCSRPEAYELSIIGPLTFVI